MLQVTLVGAVATELPATAVTTLEEHWPMSQGVSSALSLAERITPGGIWRTAGILAAYAAYAGQVTPAYAGQVCREPNRKLHNNC